VGAASVEIAGLDPGVEGPSLLPVLGEGIRDVDVVEQEERALRRAAREPPEEVAAIAGRAHELGLDPGALEEPLQEERALAFALLRPRVDAAVVGEEADRLLAEPFLGRTLQVGRLARRDRRRSAAAGARECQGGECEAARPHGASLSRRVRARPATTIAAKR